MFGAEIVKGWEGKGKKGREERKSLLGIELLESRSQ